MDARKQTEEKLRHRDETIQKSAELIRSTRELYDKYGKELTASYDRFAELEEALLASDLRIAVLGEYSRGKSSLLNALLDMDELPTAQQATTAINTFIYGLPQGESEPYIKIVYLDGREERLSLNTGSDVSALEKWGTEIDKANKEARKDVDHIDFYIDHPLLKLGLVLIDTPGLKTIHSHHEAITRRAIDHAHMAIWVQAVSQLGGNETEWEFFKDTLRRNFRKFITVINFWDLVIQPQDKNDKNKTLAQREKEKLDILKDNFRQVIGAGNNEALAALTGERSLFGVSARFGRSDDPEERKLSGIDKLFARIQEIANSPEDKVEIFYKPLQSLVPLQMRLAETLEKNMEALANTDSLEDQRRDLEQLEMDIQGIEQERKRVELDAQDNHARLAEVSRNEVERDIVEPMLLLKNEIESLVTEDYVARQIARRVSAIDLPEGLRKRYEETMTATDAQWQKQRQVVTSRLEQLRLEFADAMNKYTDSISSSFQNLNVELPRLDISWQPDFSGLERYYREQQELQDEMSRHQNKVDELEESLEEVQANDGALEEARNRVVRAQQALIAHGSKPAPIMRSESYTISEGGMYSSPKMGQRDVPDYSNVESWQAERDRYEQIMANRDAELDRIQAEEYRKTRERISREKAIQKLQREMDRLLSRIQEKQAASSKTESDLIKEARSGLLRNTAGQLDAYIRNLQANSREGISKLFEQHLASLKQCVAEQFMDSLNAKRASKADAIYTIEKGEQEVARAKQEIENALAEVRELQARTQNMLTGGQA